MDTVRAGSMNGPKALIWSLWLPQGVRSSLPRFRLGWSANPERRLDTPATAGQRTREDGSPARGGRRSIQRDATLRWGGS